MCLEISKGREDCFFCDSPFYSCTCGHNTQVLILDRLIRVLESETKRRKIIKRVSCVLYTVYFLNFLLSFYSSMNRLNELFYNINSLNDIWKVGFLWSFAVSINFFIQLKIILWKYTQFTEFIESLSETIQGYF